MQPFLIIGLIGVVLGVFLSCARSGVDWEILQTKHYWSADTWYYGGYAAQYVATPGGYRTLISEGLCNYTNMLALEEKQPAEAARHPVQGFPGTERLATPFLVYALLHVPGEASNPWGAFWQANVLLWLLSIFLAHRVAALFFPDRCSPWFAAIFVALYPALTLTFGAIKQQPLGAIFMLFGIYLFEGRLRRAALPLRFIALSALLFFGQFADGGWCFLAAFILVRAWWIPGREKWETLACAAAAVGASELWLAWLGGLYHLPSAQHSLGFSFARMAGDSWRWLAAWVAGGDVTSLSFLNFPGFTFFSVYWPSICRGFLLIHTPLLLAAVAGLVLEPRSRMFTLLAVPMLFVGHSGTIIAGWLFYYGYLSFPAAVMVILAASGTLGSLVARRAALPRTAALALGVCACWSFTDLKRQAGIYYGEEPGYYRRRVEVRFGNDDRHDTY